MKKKTFIAIVLVVASIMVISLAGCKKDKPAETPSAPANQVETPSKPVELDTNKADSIIKDLEKTDPEAAKAFAAIIAEAAKDAQTQTLCPVEGAKINKDIFVEYQGKKVYFCCQACKKKFTQSPEQFLPKLPQFKK